MCPKVFFSLKHMKQTIAKIVKKTAVWACLGRGFARKIEKHEQTYPMFQDHPGKKLQFHYRIKDTK
jgi:hypothetical protein